MLELPLEMSIRHCGDHGQEGLAMGRETQCQRVFISDCFRSEGKGDLGVKGNVLIDNVDIFIFVLLQ